MVSTTSGRLRGCLAEQIGVQVQVEWVEQALATAQQSDGEEQLLRFLFRQFLVSDLNLISAGCLPCDLQMWHNKHLQGSFVLQVDEVVNIAKPIKDRYTADSKGRCLKLLLTDGCRQVAAVEMTPVPALDAMMPAGTKVAVKDVLVRRGVLLLRPNNIWLLGGHVNRLESARQRVVQHFTHTEVGRPQQVASAQETLTAATAVAWPPQSPHANPQPTQVVTNAANQPQPPPIAPNSFPPVPAAGPSGQSSHPMSTLATTSNHLSAVCQPTLPATRLRDTPATESNRPAARPPAGSRSHAPQPVCSTVTAGATRDTSHGLSPSRPTEATPSSGQPPCSLQQPTPALNPSILPPRQTSALSHGFNAASTRRPQAATATTQSQRPAARQLPLSFSTAREALSAGGTNPPSRTMLPSSMLPSSTVPTVVVSSSSAGVSVDAHNVVRSIGGCAASYVDPSAGAAAGGTAVPSSHAVRCTTAVEHRGEGVGPIDVGDGDGVLGSQQVVESSQQVRSRRKLLSLPKAPGVSSMFAPTATTHTGPAGLASSSLAGSSRPHHTHAVLPQENKTTPANIFHFLDPLPPCGPPTSLLHDDAVQDDDDAVQDDMMQDADEQGPPCSANATNHPWDKEESGANPSNPADQIGGDGNGDNPDFQEVLMEWGEDDFNFSQQPQGPHEDTHIDGRGMGSTVPSPLLEVSKMGTGMQPATLPSAAITQPQQPTLPPANASQPTATPLPSSSPSCCDPHGSCAQPMSLDYSTGARGAVQQHGSQQYRNEAGRGEPQVAVSNPSPLGIHTAPWTYLATAAQQLPSQPPSSFPVEICILGSVKTIKSRFQFMDDSGAALPKFSIHIEIEDGSLLCPAVLCHHFIARFVGIATPTAYLDKSREPGGHEEVTQQVHRLAQYLARFVGRMQVHISHPGAVPLVTDLVDEVSERHVMELQSRLQSF